MSGQKVYGVLKDHLATKLSSKMVNYDLKVYYAGVLGSLACTPWALYDVLMVASLGSAFLEKVFVNSIPDSLIRFRLEDGEFKMVFGPVDFVVKEAWCDDLDTGLHDLSTRADTFSFMDKVARQTDVFVEDILDWYPSAEEFLDVPPSSIKSASSQLQRIIAEKVMPYKRISCDDTRHIVMWLSDEARDVARASLLRRICRMGNFDATWCYVDMLRERDLGGDRHDPCFFTRFNPPWAPLHIQRAALRHYFDIVMASDNPYQSLADVPLYRCIMSPEAWGEDIIEPHRGLLEHTARMGVPSDNLWRILGFVRMDGLLPLYLAHLDCSILAIGMLPWEVIQPHISTIVNYLSQTCSTYEARVHSASHAFNLLIANHVAAGTPEDEVYRQYFEENIGRGYLAQSYFMYPHRLNERRWRSIQPDGESWARYTDNDGHCPLYFNMEAGFIVKTLIAVDDFWAADNIPFRYLVGVLERFPTSVLLRVFAIPVGEHGRPFVEYVMRRASHAIHEPLLYLLLRIDDDNLVSVDAAKEFVGAWRTLDQDDEEFTTLDYVERRFVHRC